MIYISGDNLPTSFVRQMAQKVNAKPWPSEASPLLKNGLDQRFPKSLSVLVKNLDEDKLTELFFLPVSSVIDAEALDTSIEAFIKRVSKPSLDKGLNFLLTCPVVYKTNIAQIFTQALNRYLHFSVEQFDNVHFALHESIVNGLIHGNLRVNSMMRQSARDFVEYARLLQDRLNDPEYAHKSISIMASWNAQKLEIKIRDEGVGYAPLDEVATQTTVQAKSGRGLRIIAGTADSCTIEDFGREVTLSFLLEDKTIHHWAENYVDEQPKKMSQSILNTELSDCRVLVIEDNLSNQTVLTRLINIMGIQHIAVANDGIEGLKKVESFAPDLIILDITMPRMNGYEVLRELKKDKATSTIPVLIQTAADNREAREKTFSCGATDFITKPVNPLEFFARVRVHLENRLLIQSLEKQLSKVEGELLSAQRMQVGLLPSKANLEEMKTAFHLDIAQYFSPSSVLGGDFWQMFPLSKDKLCFYLCDFSGHGVAAALNTFRLHALISQLDKSSLNPAEFLRLLNAQLYDLLPRGQFATLFLGILDLEKKEMVYAGADAPCPMIINRKRQMLLHTEGMPLGIVAKPRYKNYRVKVHKGDSLFMYSDALIESQNEKGERLNYEGLKKLALPFMLQTNVQSGLKGIMQGFFQFAPPPPSDDITSVLMRVRDK